MVATASYKGVLGDNVVWPEFTSHKDGTPPPDGTSGGIDCHNSMIGCNGLFWRNAYFKPLKLKDIIDGQSKTLMVGECVVGQDFHSAAFFADGDWASANVPLNFFLVGFDEQGLIDKWYEVRGFRSLHPGVVRISRSPTAPCRSSRKASITRSIEVWPHAMARRSCRLPIDRRFVPRCAGDPQTHGNEEL